MPAPDSGQAPHPPTSPHNTAPPSHLRRGGAAPRPSSALKSKTDLAIETAIDVLIAEAPPLSAESRARLAELLSAGTHPCYLTGEQVRDRLARSRTWGGPGFGLGRALGRRRHRCDAGGGHDEMADSMSSKRQYRDNVR